MQMPLGPPTVTSLLALAAMLLGLSVAVQILQEVWKFFTGSRAKSFSNVLIDFVGPWSKLLAEDGPTSLLQVRGPFQFFKHRPGGKLLPAKKDDLLEAMDKILGGWIRYALAILKREARLQAASGLRGRDGTRLENVPPSDALQKLWQDIDQVDAGAPGYADAVRIAALMDRYALPGGVNERRTLDAGVVVEAIYQEFFPERLIVDQHYDQLMENFKYTYERRSLRQTFVIAFLFAIVFAFPFDDLYRESTQLSPEQAIALAQQTKALYERVNAPPVKPPTEPGHVAPTEPERPGRTTTGAARTYRVQPGTERPTDATGAHPAGSATTAVLGSESAAAGDTSASAPSVDATPDKALGDLKAALEILSKVSIDAANTTKQASTDFYMRGVTRLLDLRGDPLELLGYFFGCFATAIFVCFGAPFWNRLTTALLSKAQPASADPRGATSRRREE